MRKAIGHILQVKKLMINKRIANIKFNAITLFIFSKTREEFLPIIPHFDKFRKLFFFWIKSNILKIIECCPANAHIQHDSEKCQILTKINEKQINWDLGQVTRRTLSQHQFPGYLVCTQCIIIIQLIQKYFLWRRHSCLV